jgi:hypothetical protein
MEKGDNDNDRKIVTSVEIVIHPDRLHNDTNIKDIDPLVQQNRNDEDLHRLFQFRNLLI